MNNYTLYKHITPSGKVYIGITNQKPEHRWNNGKGYMNVQDGPFKRSILKYGWNNIQHIILVNNLSEWQAKAWEVKLIKHYKSLGISLNITDGGEGVHGNTPWNKGLKGIAIGTSKGSHFTDEHKAKLRYSHLGKQLPRKEHIIYVYDLKGNFITSFNDITSCCKALNVTNSNVDKALKGIRNHIGKYQLRDQNTLHIPLKYLDEQNGKETYPIIAINKNTKQSIYLDSVFDLPRMLNRKVKQVLDTIRRQGSYFGWYYVRAQ